MFRTFTFSFDEVCPDKQVLMGYLQTPTEESYLPVSGIVEKVFSQLKHTKEIIGGYRILPCEALDVKAGVVSCFGGQLQTGRRVCGYMTGASKIALFLCTAGETFTTLSHAYQREGDFLEAFVVESIGSATVENAMDQIQISLGEEMATTGENITNRYSPGYCEWALSGQRDLFACIGEQPTGITIGASCLMQPIKSVSGIIGIGKAVRKRPYGCAVCDSTTCVYRNIKRRN